MSNKSNEYYDKKIDNALKKKELQQEFGMNFLDTDCQLSPEMEGAWLNHIANFEKQFQNAVPISVWDFIGKPAFKKISDIAPKELSFELERVNQVLSANAIALDTLCEVEEAELYRFITEELFLHEIDNMRIEGMMTNFIYEEFHPNPKYDIKQACDYFFRMTLRKVQNVGRKGYDMLYVDTDNYIDANGNKLAKRSVEDSINNFLDSFDHFEIIKNEVKDISINNKSTAARVNFYIHYHGKFDNSKELMDFEGDGSFNLKPSKYGGWSITNIALPGLSI